MELNNNLEENIKKISNGDSDTEDDNSDNNDEISSVTNNPSIPKTANILAKIVLSNKVTKNAVTNYVEKNPKKAAGDMVKLYNLFSKNKKDKLSEEEINNKIKSTTTMINEMMPVFMNYMASHYPQDKQVNFEINNVVECDGRKIKYHVIVSE